MKVFGRRCLLSAGFLGMLSSMALPVSAALDFHPLYGFSLSYSDNATLAPRDEKDDWIFNAYLGAELAYKTSELTSKAVATVSRESYLDDTFDAETYANLETSAAWTIVEDRIVLEVQDIFSQKPVRSIDVQTPDNSQNVNAFSIGPAFTIPAGDRQQVTIQPVYQNYYFEKSNFGSQRYLLYSMLQHKLTPTRELSLHADIGKVDYYLEDPDTGISPDFDVQKVYAGFTSEQRLSKYTIHFGGVNIDRKAFLDQKGLYGSFVWTGGFTESSDLIVKLASDLTDNGTGLLDIVTRLDEGAVIGSASNIDSAEQIAADVMRNSQLRVLYRRHSSILISDFWFSLHKLNYKVLPLDRDVGELGARFDYKMNPRMTAQLHARFRKTNERNEGSDYNRYVYGTGLRYSLSRDYSLGFDLYRNEKSSNNKNSEYVENKAVIRFIYTR
ncbi:MAG: hypothetical protein V3W04_04295 [Gammaproteobacteria bacterium]